MPRAILFAVSVAGKNLQQPLASGVVLALAKLVVQARVQWRVDTPAQAVRNDHGIEAPLRELLEKLARRGGVLAAIRRERPSVHAARTHRHLRQALEPPEQIGIG